MWSSSVLLDAVIRSITVERRDRYLTDTAPVATYRRDLLRLILLDSDAVDPVPYLCKRAALWYQGNKSLLLKNGTLEYLSMQQVPTKQHDVWLCVNTRKIPSLSYMSIDFTTAKGYSTVFLRRWP